MAAPTEFRRLAHLILDGVGVGGRYLRAGDSHRQLRGGLSWSGGGWLGGGGLTVMTWSGDVGSGRLSGLAWSGGASGACSHGRKRSTPPELLDELRHFQQIPAQVAIEPVDDHSVNGQIAVVIGIEHFTELRDESPIRWACRWHHS